MKRPVFLLTMTIVLAIILLSLIIYGIVRTGQNDTPVEKLYSGKFIALEPTGGIKTSFFVYDVHTDLVYLIIKHGDRSIGFSPYYIVDESNTQRIAVYPKDLDYLQYPDE